MELPMSKNAQTASIENAPLPFVMPDVIPTTATTIAGIDVELPAKFFAGMTYNDITAKITDAAVRRQFANNQNAAFAAWEKKAKAWDESTASDKGERPANPCTADAMLEAFKTYLPKVGEASQTALEKMREEAGLLVLHELISQHNAAVDAKDAGNYVKAFPAGEKVALKKGKGAAEEREAWVAKVLRSASLNDRVQAHIDALVNAAKTAKPEAGVKELAISEEAEF